MERPNNGRRIGFTANVWTQFELAAKQSIRSPERPALFSNTTRLELRFLGKTTPPGTAKHQEKSQIVLSLLEPQNGGLRFHAGSTDIKLMPFYCNIWLC
jgi:hypothetical protein